ncbi:MAG: HAMP domain-containing sensor histidine kinase [Acidimicrobiales bacterium]
MQTQLDRRRRGLEFRRAASWRRLRVRIAVRVAAVAAAIAIGLGVGTYLVVRDALIDERQRGAVEQVRANSRLVASGIRSTGISETELLASLRPQVRARPLLYRDGRWFTASLQIQPDQLPNAFVDAALDGEAVRQRFDIDGSTVLGVGLPVDEVSIVYFEVFSLGDLEETLDTLAAALLIGAVVSTIIGAALGHWIGSSVVRPLDAVSTVAEQIAAGSLDSRLSAADDLDLQRLSQSFNSMADALQRRVQREARFASDVSHELRSPLTTLLTSAAVLENRRHELSDDGREALDLLSGDLARFQRMVIDLTEMSKHDAGVVVADRSEVGIAELVERTLRRLRRPDIELVVEPSGAEPLVVVNEPAVERIMANLIENADHHADGVHRITVEGDATTTRVLVDDRGPGVPVESRERIFDRFARVGPGRLSLGSGLGLALVSETVIAFGGRIWCDDSPEGGARFVIELPRSDR